MSKDENAAIFRCLDSVDSLLVLRQAAADELAEGWMEIARARYSMGNSRINHSLFSLKPHHPQALASVTDAAEMKLLETRGEAEDPLYWFGNLVSPHLRSSQQCFKRALRILIKVANAQKDAQINI